jgi:hypothetical protein
MDSTNAQVQVSEPKLYTSGAIAVVSAYGLIGIVPVIFLFLIVSLLGFKLSTLLIGVAVIALIIWLLPLVSGNPYVTKLVRRLVSDAACDPKSFVVQLTLSPRLRSDLRALAEDADDIGCLTVNASGFTYHGDSIKLSVPFQHIARVERKYRGLRSLFVPRIVVTVTGLDGVASFEFGERSSIFLPASRKTSKALYELLSTKTVAAKPLAA